MRLVERALAIATRLHDGQTRKGSDPPVPYITHPIEVMEIVRAHGGSEIEQAGALCHDTAEDQGGRETIDELRRELGDEVAAIVEGCSDSLLPKGAEKAAWRERKESYIAHLRAERSRSTLLVSCADKLANARAILRDLRDPSVGAKVWTRFKAGRDEQLWYYGTLAEVFCERLPGGLSDALADTVDEMQEAASRLPRGRGLRNSSLTRVRPFFRALFERDASGEAWLPGLLASAPRTDGLPADIRARPGALRAGVTTLRSHGGSQLEAAFEYAVAPSAGFLRYLLSHPEKLTWPEREGARVIFGKATTRKREALLAADPATMGEALALLAERGGAGSRRAWWAFEGFTQVDCCLETDRLVLFIEGKRTELLSDSTQWFPGRNQLARNLEAIGEVAAGRACGVLLVCEDPVEEPADTLFDRALPHLTPPERATVRARYLGQTTWRALCGALDVPLSALPDTVETG